MFSTPGPTPDAAVRAATKGALLKWAREVALPLARGQTLDGARVRMMKAAVLMQGLHGTAMMAEGV